MGPTFYARILVITALVVLGLVAPGAAVAAGADPKPDLAALTPRGGSALAAPGGALEVTAKVTNVGSRKAGATKTAFYLSTDGRKGKGDVALGSASTPQLAPGKSKRVLLDGKVPRSIKSRAYRVVACADAKHQIREAREANNCKASQRTVKITARYDSTPFGPAEPVNVSPVPDPSHSITKRITPAGGGQLALSLPNGTTYTLNVPAGALAQSEDIKMTALSNVGGDPFGGGFVAGVQLQPEGLQFEKAVQLRIHPASPIATSRETPFSATAGGNGFHLQPPLVAPSDPTFALLHFTIVGLFNTSALQRTAQAGRNPTDPQSALEQQVGKVFIDARARGELTAADLEKIGKLGRLYYDRVVRPSLADAANADKCAGLTQKRLAVARALLWARQMELVGVDGLMGGRIDEMRDLVQKVATAPCGFPRSWRGPVSGVVSYSGGLTETWSGELTFDRDSQRANDADYTLSAGSLHWQLSGTDTQDCTWSGSATLGASGVGNVRIKPDGYGFNVGTTTFSVPVMKTCPPPFGTDEVDYEVLRNANWGSFFGDASAYSPGQTTIQGSRTDPNPFDPGGTVSIDWSLAAG